MSGPFRPSIVRQTATPRPRSDHLLHVPSAIHPSFQPLHNHFPNHPTTTPTITQPRLNHPSCRIQERFRHNHPTSVILQLQPQNSAADSPRIKVLYTRSAVECAGDCGERGRMRPRDWRRGNGSHAGRQTGCRAAARGQHRDENERPPFSSLPRSMREQGRRQGDCRRKVRRHRYGCPRCSFCCESSTQRSRKRVTLVMRPATPRPVPSKKRQMFNS